MMEQSTKDSKEIQPEETYYTFKKKKWHQI